MPKLPTDPVHPVNPVGNSWIGSSGASPSRAELGTGWNVSLSNSEFHQKFSIKTSSVRSACFKMDCSVLGRISRCIGTQG